MTVSDRSIYGLCNQFYCCRMLRHWRVCRWWCDERVVRYGKYRKHGTLFYPMLVWRSSLQIVRLIKQCVVSKNGSRHNGSRAILSPSCSRSRNITFTFPKRQSKWTQIGRCSWESVARCNDVPRGNNSEFGLVIVCIGQSISYVGCSWIIIYKFTRHSYYLPKLDML